MPTKNRPLTPLMIEALTSLPYSRTSGQWSHRRQIKALMVRNLVKKNAITTPPPYRFQLTRLGTRIKQELLSITTLAMEILSGGPHETHPRRKRTKPNFLSNPSNSETLK